MDRALDELFRVVARYCRGATLVEGAAADGLGDVLKNRQRNRRVTAAGRDGGLEETPAADTFDTVVLLEVLDRVSEHEAREILADAARRLEPAGRLVVVVANEGCIADPIRVRFYDRRRLKHELRTLGKPKLVKEQPFRWLVMYVQKGSDVKEPPPAAVRRYRATADLCHGRVVELGCGRGHLTRMIRDRRLEVVGLELNACKVTEARRLWPDIPFLRADIRRVPLRNESFDTAIIAEVLEHVPEPIGDEMLAQAWALLRPSGRLIVSVPNEDCIPHSNHVRTFTCKGLVDMLRPFGTPVVVSGQPFKWLMAYTVKAPAGTPSL